MTLDKCYSRLDRLFILLENGTTLTTRNAAAKQLGDVQKKHPHELNELLARLLKYLQSKEWDTRLAAAEAVKAVVAQVPLWTGRPGEKVESDDQKPWYLQGLELSSFDVKQALSKSQVFLGSAGTEFESDDDESLDDKEKIIQARRRLEKSLGLAIGGKPIGVSSQEVLGQFIEDEDLVSYKHVNSGGTKSQLPTNKLTPRAIKEEKNDPVQPPTAMSNRERNRAKRKDRVMSRQNSKEAHMKGDCSPPEKRKKLEKLPDKETEASNESVPKHNEAPETWTTWPFDWFCSELLNLLYSPKWEWRHGSCLALRNLLNIHGSGAGVHCGNTPVTGKTSNAAWLENTAVRILYVMLLDRFSDFVSDQVVAPVRESCAQVIGVISKLLSTEAVTSLLNILIQFTQVPEWEVRHAGFLGMKYVLAVREDMHESAITQCLPSLIKGLCDDDGDVKSVSAEALIPTTKFLVRHEDESAHGNVHHHLFRVLCDSLHVLDELSASTQSILTLISKITKAMSVESIKAHMNVKNTISHLWLFTRHSILAVRKAALSTVDSFLSISGVLDQDMSESGPLSHGVWNLFLCCILESDESLQQMALVVSQKFFTQIRQPVLCDLCRQYFTSMFSMVSQPNNIPFPEIQMNGRPHSDENTEQSLKYIGGNPSVWKSQHTNNCETLDEIVMRTRENSARLVGIMCAHVMKTSDMQTNDGNLPEFIHVLLQALSSHIALHRMVTAMILSSWWKVKVSVPHVQFHSALLQALSEDIYFNELSPSFILMQSEVKSAFLLASQIQTVPFELKQSFSVEDALSLCAEIEKLTTGLDPEHELRISHGRLTHIAEETQQLHHRLQRTVRVYISHCVVTAALLPTSDKGGDFSISQIAKLNPIIRPLMDGVKKESNLLIRNTISRALAYLMDVCSNRDPCPNGKLLNNLCKMLSADKAFCPDINDPVEGMPEELLERFQCPIGDAVCCANITLLKKHTSMISENPGRKKKGEKPLDGLKSEMSVARMGALACVQFFCEYFKNRIFNILPQLWTTMSESHMPDNSSSSNANGAMDTSHFSSKMLSLLVIEACSQKLDEEVSKETVLVLLPQLFELSWNYYSAVRYVSCRCLSALAKRFTSEVMTMLVQQLLSGMDAQDNLYKRMGTVELVSNIIDSVQTSILPYTVLLIVPLLGRMSDQNLQVRLAANGCFASLIQYLPVESSIPDPPNVPSSLIEQKKSNRRFLEQLLDSKSLEEYPIPIPINAKLRKYQEEGVKWLAFLNRYKLHGILCDDMGLGKTLQAICILASDHFHKKQQQLKNDCTLLRSLVISPPTLTGHWVDEIQKFCSVEHLNPLHYAGHPSERTRLQSKIKKHNLVIASYEVVRNDINFFTGFDWNYCILDEGHMIRNGKNRLSMCVKSIKCSHRLILTGTPIQNSVLELWSLFDFLMPGFLGSEQEFNYRFSKPILASRDAKSSSKEQEEGVMAMEALHRQVLPFMMRRMKEDVLPDLPPKIIQDYYCNLSPLQVHLYEDFAKTKAKKEVDVSISQVETDQSQTSRAKHTSHVFQALQYLQKVCNHPALVLTPCHPEYATVSDQLSKEKSTLHDVQHSCKLVALKQLLLDCGIGTSGDAAMEAVISQHRALIFCQHKSMLDIVERDLLRKHMKSVTFLRLDGSVPAKNRHVIVSKFNNDPSIDLLLLTTKVGGLGLNLTGADTVIFIEHDWNPTVDLQAMDRAHRIGQKRVVNVYRLITRGTLEEKILGLQRFKLNVANTIISAENSNLRSMDTSQVLDLFTIGRYHENEQKRAEDGGKKGLRALLDDIGELWDQNLYDNEYNLDNFMEHLIPPSSKK